MRDIVRKLAVGSVVLMMTACASNNRAPYLELDLSEAEIMIYALDVNDFREVTFEGDPPRERTGKRALMSGAGAIAIGKNRIQFNRNEVEVNGKPIPARTRPGYSNYILYPDGKLETGFIRSFD